MISRAVPLRLADFTVMLTGWWLALTICCSLQAGLLALTACFKLVVLTAGEAFSHNVLALTCRRQRALLSSYISGSTRRAAFGIISHLGHDSTGLCAMACDRSNRFGQLGALSAQRVWVAAGGTFVKRRMWSRKDGAQRWCHSPIAPSTPQPSWT